MGGGRACDTCKYVADKMDKPLFTIPTVASNCAAVTAICVIYNPDGSFREYYYPKLAEHTFINTAVIADSPYELLWAGIGDALSKEFEAVFSSAPDALSHTPLMGVKLSEVCTEPLLDYGAEALRACRDKQATRALEQVTLDIIISTGLVSNMTTQIPQLLLQRLAGPLCLLRCHRDPSGAQPPPRRDCGPGGALPADL